MNIFLISIDNLRYDCVGYQPFKKELEKYGVSHLLETSTLDGIAEKSVCFTQAITTAPYTTSAHASLLTGLYPPQNGLRAFWNHRLKSDIKTLPEVLKSFGYKSALHTTSVHFNNMNGLNRGIDYYFERYADLVKFLSENRNEKIFALVHFFDVHAPFGFSEGEYSPGCNDDYFRDMEVLYKEHSREKEFSKLKDKPYELWNNFFEKTVKDLAFCYSSYVNGVNKFDRGQFKHFITLLRELELYENSFISISADHGEGESGRNGRFTHLGEIYDNVIRIPIIISHPDFEHRVIDGQVSIVDIVPTALDTVIGKPSSDILSYELSGTSLFAEKSDSYAYCETWFGAMDEPDIFKREYYLGQRCLRTTDKKYVVNGKVEDLFNASMLGLANGEFVKNLHRALLIETQSNGFEKYTEMLDGSIITKNDLLYMSVGLQGPGVKGRFLLYDIANDPFEENPEDPSKDFSLAADFAKSLNRILSIEGNKGQSISYAPMNVVDRTQESEPLEKKEKLSMDTIREAVDKFGMRAIAATFTGGKDSTVMLHLIKRTFNDVIPIRVFNIDTGFKFKEIYEFRDMLAKQWNMYLIILKNEEALKSADLISDHGRCCHLLKTTPLNDAIKEYSIKALMTAVRWDEQEARTGEKYFSDRGDHVRVQPILHFTEKNIWDYIRKYSLPYCSLYDRGYRSLGCEPCTQISEPGGPERSGRSQEKEKIMSKLRELGYF